jgi:hypothetical protein
MRTWNNTVCNILFCPYYTVNIYREFFQATPWNYRDCKSVFDDIFDKSLKSANNVYSLQKIYVSDFDY